MYMNLRFSIQLLSPITKLPSYLSIRSQNLSTISFELFLFLFFFCQQVYQCFAASQLYSLLVLNIVHREHSKHGHTFSLISLYTRTCIFISIDTCTILRVDFPVIHLYALFHFPCCLSTDNSFPSTPVVQTQYLSRHMSHPLRVNTCSIFSIAVFFFLNQSMLAQRIRR